MPMTRTLADDVLQFRLEDERLTMTGSEPFARSGRSARTLVKDGPLRVTLIALGAGGASRSTGPRGPSPSSPCGGRSTSRPAGRCGASGPGTC